jgi:hypothetical protein
MEKRKEGKIRNWLKKLQIKGFMAGVLVTVILSGTVLVSANTGGAIREVFYGVSVVVNGSTQNLTGDMAPFVSDGRTFLPVRGISEALNVPVTWDGATRTVHIGTQLVGSPFFSTIQHFRHGGRNLTIGNAVSLGNTHANALMSDSSLAGEGWREYNLNAQWNTLSGTVLRLDRAGTGPQTITFIGDGRELLVVTTNENQQPQNISVDVSGVLILRIEVSGRGSALHNAMIQ